MNDSLDSRLLQANQIFRSLAQLSVTCCDSGNKDDVEAFFIAAEQMSKRGEDLVDSVRNEMDGTKIVSLKKRREQAAGGTQ